MQNENFINTRDLLGALAEAMNFINPDIENHHQQTAYLMLKHDEPVLNQIKCSKEQNSKS